ncbi:MAG TPA: tRNA (adenosine(37)-N6)-dimethylallyltransferase MiaA [Verrucomicrobiota bacterium]|nr:tRNA (adenosine(37)-N6)-dimethylallyltransferase MiaA [Verrucomicrobiota bacterium]HNT13550.1 tRNA (adenosine(37)-N6)-dimethylallyltransferase MiaA [Verrucomicrobiota bacterium]
MSRSSPDPAAGPAPLYIAGPTAVGKSDLALALAERDNGEIISVDSMQVYRGLDIGTAKPSAAERARVPHHLLDVAELTETFDAARFVAAAQQAVADIQARGRRPIFCGGTGLYFKAYLEGLGSAPASVTALRRELEMLPLPVLLHELAERDPITLARIDRHNLRRVVRAVEVIRLTGRPFSDQRAEWRSAASLAADGPRCFCLTRPAADLRARIDARVEGMFAAGLVEETRRLQARGLARNKTALQAIGYRQVIAHLRGEHGLAETIELVKTRTRQLAKRQLTWFRKHLAAQWVELRPGDGVAETLNLITPLR